MTTPLLCSGNEYVSPQSLLWTLVYQILWIPVPGRLETFAQGRMLAVFVGMTLDYFQSDTFVQLRQSQGREGLDSKVNGSAGAEGPVSSSGTTVGGPSSQRNISQAQMERNAAVEPFRTMLEQRLEFLETIAHDRPGFKGFVQGMGQYKEQRSEHFI